MRSTYIFVGAAFPITILFTNVLPTAYTAWRHVDECGHNLSRPSGFFDRHIDFPFLKKFFTHWIPFKRTARVEMRFYLYKGGFPDCGREIIVDDDETLEVSGFDSSHPTRIVIHGWMSQSKGPFNRAVKNAYLNLARQTSTTSVRTNVSMNVADDDNADKVSLHDDVKEKISDVRDYNVIVIDWSVISSNVNYFGVVELTEDLGFLVAEFVRYLHIRAGLHYNDVYLIGHSIGAQIAGSAGKQIYPYKFNTIFALDPAGPKFRDQTDEFRIDPSDANYVESIQTSSTLGFKEPVGHATFYPNFGRDQKRCYIYGCSHSRAYDYFAESIGSTKGFWGTLCQRKSDDVWLLSVTGAEFRMGGEPALPKRGTFYVKTNNKRPYARGKRKNDHFKR